MIPTGLGGALTVVPSLLTVNFYFKKRRSRASAFCFCGNAIGGFVMPMFIQFLMVEYTFSGCLFLMAGIMLNILPCALLLRPLNPPPKRICRHNNNSNQDISLKQKSEEEKSDSTPVSKNDKPVKSAVVGCFDKFVNYFDGEILKSPRLLAMLSCASLLSMGSPHSLAFLHAHFRLVDVG